MDSTELAIREDFHDVDDLPQVFLYLKMLKQHW